MTGQSGTWLPSLPARAAWRGLCQTTDRAGGLTRAVLARSGLPGAGRYHRAGERCRGEVSGCASTSWDWRSGWSCLVNCVELLGGDKGGFGLGGAVLGLAQLGDSFGERGKMEDEDGGGAGAVAAEASVGGHEAGGATELVACRGGSGDAPAGFAGGAVVEVGGLA